MDNKSSGYKISFKVEGKTSQSDWGMKGDLYSAIAFFVVFILSVFFVIRAFTEDSNFWFLAVFTIILTMAFGPYQMWIKKYYFFGWREDNKLELRSIINFIPRSYVVDMNMISRIEWDSPLKSASLKLFDREGKIRARFNPFMMNQVRFKTYLDKILELNGQIKSNF